ncbi:MAG TPA: hypothetical protein VJ851_08980 [Jatrophihabitans sp.]|nr:hypothetical protein [Jatrophihabitans sp.]
MDEFEHSIRQTMLSHDRDISGPVSLPQPPTTRSTGWLVPAIAAVTVALLIGVTVIALHKQNSRQQATGALAATASNSVVPPLQSCPASIPNPFFDKHPNVPAAATVPDGGQRLIPAQVPAASLLCGYPTPVGTTPDRIGLAASNRLTAGLETLADQLGWLPPANPAAAIACGDVPTLDPPGSYLLELAYPGGTSWVSLPASRCGTSIGNGDFDAVASSDVLTAAAEAYRSGIWPASAAQPEVCSGSESAGRLGQQSAMAPSGLASISICHANQSYLLNAAGSYTPIVQELDSLRSTPSTGSCVGTGNGSYVIRLDYPTGPSVEIRVTPGCQPSVDNGSLQATASATCSRCSLPRPPASELSGGLVVHIEAPQLGDRRDIRIISARPALAARLLSMPVRAGDRTVRGAKNADDVVMRVDVFDIDRPPRISR